MSYNQKQQELSPSASLIKKKSKQPNTSDKLDKMANTVTHFEDILRTELTAMRNEFASHISVVQSLCSKLDLLTGEMREQKKVVADHDGRVAALEQQVVDLQDRKCGWIAFRFRKGRPYGLFENIVTDVAPISGGQRDWSGASASRVHKALLKSR